MSNTEQCLLGICFSLTQCFLEIPRICEKGCAMLCLRVQIRLF